MSIAAGTRLGPYEILAPIGAGGMGEVYRAKDARLGREVAVKILPPSFSQDAERLRRFELEASSTSELNHPNILTVFDVGEHEGTSYIVSELLQGETLREHMDGAALAVRRAVDYAVQVARGLAAAHERGVVHRDLKPENLFVTSDERVKILDFGIAKQVETGNGAEGLTDALTRKLGTSPGAVIGTAGYMSPEQARGRGVDHRSDIFSFGAVLYEMLAGRRAFGGESAIETLHAVVKEDPPDFSAATDRQIPPALARVVWHCLEKRPERRFQSAGDVAFALEALSGTGASSELSATTAHAPPAPQPKWRARLPWLVATVAVLAAALAIAFAFLRRAPEPAAPTVRFTILAPENMDQIGPPIVSPDGSRVVFRLNSPGGKDMLWIRSLDSTEAQQLAGTEDGGQPFWSPDGRAVAFFTPGGLKKVDLSGGPAQTLTDAQGSFGGTWGRDGVILFSHRGGSGGLHRIPATGGEAVAVTTPDAARKETNHVWPYFLPDGRHFLYLARSTQREHGAIYVGSLDSKETKRLVAADASAAYAPPGYLLYVRESTLMAQPFDADRLELTGDPFPVAEQVAANQSNARGMFSVSAGGVLAFRGGSVINNQLSWFDRGGKHLETLSSQPGRYFAPRISPDEKRIATDRIDPQTPGTTDIWLLELGRGSSTRFTFDAADDGTPIWSPDGSSVAFYSNRGGATAIYRKPASGAGEDQVLINSAETTFANDWSPDGRFILYQQLSPQTNWDLWVLPLDGERKPTPFMHTNFAEIQARFSPDGRWIAYTSSESGQWQVYVRSFPEASGKWMVSTDGGAQPRWGGDGGELYYLAPDRNLMAVEVEGDSATFEAGVPRPLFEMRNVGGFPGGGGYDVTRDGKRFLVNMAAQEENPRPITVVLNWTAGLKPRQD